MPSQITNYQCPSCTGPLRYDGASGMLKLRKSINTSWKRQNRQRQPPRQRLPLRQKQKKRTETQKNNSGMQNRKE